MYRGVRQSVHIIHSFNMVNTESHASHGGCAMDSASDISGRDDSGHDDHQLSRDADRLLTEHGEDADHIAARRADTLFRDGDMQGGARWLKVFRRIAMTHRRRATD